MKNQKISGINLIYLTTLFFLLSGMTAAGQNLPDSPQIIYVSGSSCFLNIGKENGVMVGDSIHFDKSATIVIVSISAKRSAAKNPEGDVPVSLLNQAIPVLYLQSISTRKLIIEAPSVTKTETPDSKWNTVSDKKKTEKSKPAVTGYAQFQTLFQTYTIAGKSFSYWQPGLGVGLEVPDFPSKYWGMRLRFRTLYDNQKYNRNYDPNKSFFNSLSNRVYESSIYYDEKETGTYFQAGRFSVRNLWTAGILDGANYEQKIATDWSSGILLGTSPDYRELGFNSQNPKYGGYVIHKTSEKQTESAGWIGEYVEGTLSREYLSHQISWYGDGWSWFQSGDIDINRNWKGKRDDAVVLSNLMVSGRYQVTSYFDSYGSVDIRRPIWTADIKSIADTLFDKRYQEGITIGGTFEYFDTYFTDASLGYRYHDGDNVGTIYLSLVNGNRNLYKSGWSLTSRTSLYLNEFYLGTTETIGTNGTLPFDFNGDASVTFQGWSLSSDSALNFDYLFQVGLSRLILSNLYGYFSYELATGKTLDYNRFFMTMSYRF